LWSFPTNIIIISRRSGL